jgi:hypothetical protein
MGSGKQLGINWMTKAVHQMAASHYLSDSEMYRGRGYTRELFSLLPVLVISSEPMINVGFGEGAARTKGGVFSFPFTFPYTLENQI